jgi:hypothetical protein
MYLKGTDLLLRIYGFTTSRLQLGYLWLCWGGGPICSSIQGELFCLAFEWNSGGAVETLRDDFQRAFGFIC